MARRKPDVEEPEQRSTAAGGCVLVVLGGLPLAAVWAVSDVAGVLAVWVAGVAAVWWSARRCVSDSSATPPQGREPPSGDVYARETTRVREVRKGPGEGLTIFPEIEHVTDL
ncbi:hypothetical protein [Streptomyces cahuitamycinicus]|uniref:Uncharacterized protein n=1 Tax=Streptomyces cahuitamycinicus TaxID=2070367 RepID=A0A2N8TF49_9ACTN|nr:hypothetical protein [Streptomyces cahuitamycinicus]PNG17589.1 hypothetical protein C1J00_35670 [Streptomyces cahuitamycinicus]